jgi:hypothetical protein
MDMKKRDLMKKKTTRKLLRTAYHEAAHAVVLYRTTGHGCEVNIVRREGEGFIQLGGASDEVSDSSSPEDMEATILSCYAAGHAERELDPTCGAEGCDRDDEQAFKQLRLHGWEHREQELRERSLTLTRKHWPEIVAVADELLRVQLLSDTEVEIICDAAAGDEPDPDLARYRAFFPLEEWRKERLKTLNENDA